MKIFGSILSQKSGSQEDNQAAMIDCRPQCLVVLTYLLVAEDVRTLEFCYPVKGSCILALWNLHRVAKFKCPRVLGDQKISEDNQKLRPGCPPDYQNFFGKELNQTFSSQQIFQVIFLFTNKTAV